MKTVPLKIVVMIILLMSVSVTAARAGTWMLGLKGWYTSWDSSLLGWAEKDIEALFAINGVQVDVEKDPGTGYLAGPVLGFQSDDGEWSVSFAAMVFSQFSQSVDMEAAGMGEIETDGDLDRKDFDIAVTYALFKYGDSFSLFKYQNLFFGFKYQIANFDLDVFYDPGSSTQSDKAFSHKIEQKVLMPTIGTGFSYPLWDKTAAGLQLGLLYVIPDLTKKDDTGTTHIWTQPSFGFNGEITFSYLPFNNFVMQLGYRYQEWSLTASLSDDNDTETSSPDITHGLTLTLVYLF